jgi:hypothetical protein
VLPFARDCYDGDVCTTNTCEPDVGCVFVPDECDDGDPCTADSCGPDGCTHTETCDDGDPCTLDVCSVEVPCAHVDVCLDCTTGPRADCLGAGRGSLAIREAVAGRERLTFRLEKLGSLALEDFGDPVDGSTGYGLCLYDAGATLVARLRVARAQDHCRNSDPCWRRFTKRYEYRDAAATADGVVKIIAQASDASRFVLRAGNKAAQGLDSMPTGLTAALAGEESVIAQMRTTDDRCFGGHIAVRRSSSRKFKATGPAVAVTSTSTSTTSSSSVAVTTTSTTSSSSVVVTTTSTTTSTLP